MTTAQEVRNAFGYLYTDELSELKRLTRNLPDDSVIINIGAGSGTSGLAFLESNPNITLITIDVQNESSPFGCLEAERDVVRRAGLADSAGKRWFQHHGDSKQLDLLSREIKLIIDARGVQLLFIDGDHSYEGCAGDIDTWTPYVNDGGIIIVHDYDKLSVSPEKHGPARVEWLGVDKAVREKILPYYDEVEIVDTMVVATHRRPLASLAN